MTPFTDKIAAIARRLHPHRLVIGAILTMIAVVLATPPVVTTVAPGYFARYHDLEVNYDALQTSLHAGIECRACHSDSRGPVFAGLALVGDFYVGLVRPAGAPAFITFERPTRDACLACHDTQWSHEAERIALIPHPAHARAVAETRECVECHKWTAHDEPSAEVHKKMPFSGLCVAYGCHVGTKTAEECVDCHHALRDEGQEWSAIHHTVVGQRGANGCLQTCHDAGQCRQCHTTGERPVFDGLQTETGLGAIERLHIAADWTATHGPVALDDQSACTTCHVSDAECRSCHLHRPASHDPVETWIAKHKDLLEDETDDRRCLTCHEQSWCDECHELFKEMR